MSGPTSGPVSFGPGPHQAAPQAAARAPMGQRSALNGSAPTVTPAGGLTAPLAGPVTGPPTSLRPDASRRLAAKPVPSPKPRRHGLYAAAWACSGLIAGTYVFALILRQDGGPFLARSDRETIDAASLAKTQADVAQLQKSLGQIEGDVARIKVDQAQTDEREKQLVTRVATVETRVTQFGDQIAAAVAPPAAKVAKVPSPAVEPAQSLVAKGAASRIATAALPTPAPVAAPPVVAPPQAQAPANGDVAGVLLARGPSLDALRLSWGLLNERHKGTLKSMEPRVVEVEPGSFQLLAGPVANPAEALKVCSALKSRGVACQPADYRGSAL